MQFLKLMKYLAYILVFSLLSLQPLVAQAELSEFAKATLNLMRKWDGYDPNANEFLETYLRNNISQFNFEEINLMVKEFKYPKSTHPEFNSVFQNVNETKAEILKIGFEKGRISGDELKEALKELARDSDLGLSCRDSFGG